MRELNYSVGGGMGEYTVSTEHNKISLQSESVLYRFLLLVFFTFLCKEFLVYIQHRFFAPPGGKKTDVGTF